MDLSFGNFRLRSFALELSIGDPSLGNLRLVSFVWGLSPWNVCLMIFARELSLGNFRLDTLPSERWFGIYGTTPVGCRGGSPYVEGRWGLPYSKMRKGLLFFFVLWLYGFMV